MQQQIEDLLENQGYADCQEISIDNVKFLIENFSFQQKTLIEALENTIKKQGETIIKYMNECEVNKIQLAEKKKELPKWISIEDKLPEERILPVLIFNGKAPIYSQCVLQSTWFAQDKKFRVETKTVITYNDITHWMPLPTNPNN